MDVLFNLNLNYDANNHVGEDTLIVRAFGGNAEQRITRVEDLLMLDDLPGVTVDPDLHGFYRSTLNFEHEGYTHSVTFQVFLEDWDLF